jgi:23S rRNA (adenine2503-C2)-methyltransferase
MSTSSPLIQQVSILLSLYVNLLPISLPSSYLAGFGGKPTSKAGVDEFIRILGTYGVTATPRTRRGIDIDAGCGQLKSELIRKKNNEAVAIRDVEERILNIE